MQIKKKKNFLKQKLLKSILPYAHKNEKETKLCPRNHITSEELQPWIKNENLDDSFF